MKELTRYIVLAIILFLVTLTSIHLYNDEALRNHNNGYENMHIQQEIKKSPQDSVVIKKDNQTSETNNTSSRVEENNTSQSFTIEVKE